MSPGAAAGAAAAAAIANAIKANGVLVAIEAEDFRMLVKGQPNPLVVHASGGIFKTHYRYLTSYKGLAFHTISNIPLDFQAGVELIQAKSISIPG